MNKREMINNLHGTYGLVRRVWMDSREIIAGDFKKTEIKVGRDLEQVEKELLLFLSQEYRKNNNIYVEDVAIKWINENMGGKNEFQ